MRAPEYHFVAMSIPRARALLLLVLSSQVALAEETEPRPATPTVTDEKSPTPPEAAPPTAPPAAKAKLDGQEPQLGFDFFDEPGRPSLLSPSGANPGDNAVAAAVQKRRHRLEVHQVLGLTTWGLMLAASVIGQLNYYELYGGGSGSGTWLLPHRVLVYSTAIMFGATAGYALLAPTPYPKPLKLDTGLVHRIAVIGATAGMVAQIVLGFITARTADAGNPDNLQRNAQIHEVIGWTTFGFMTAAGAVWVF
jgi:hypothetical protein